MKLYIFNFTLSISILIISAVSITEASAEAYVKTKTDQIAAVITESQNSPSAPSAITQANQKEIDKLVNDINQFMRKTREYFENAVNIKYQTQIKERKSAIIEKIIKNNNEHMKALQNALEKMGQKSVLEKRVLSVNDNQLKFEYDVLTLDLEKMPKDKKNKFFSKIYEKNWIDNLSIDLLHAANIGAESFYLSADNSIYFSEHFVDEYFRKKKDINGAIRHEISHAQKNYQLLQGRESVYDTMFVTRTPSESKSVFKVQVRLDKNLNKDKKTTLKNRPSERRWIENSSNTYSKILSGEELYMYANQPFWESDIDLLNASQQQLQNYQEITKQRLDMAETISHDLENKSNQALQSIDKYFLSEESLTKDSSILEIKTLAPPKHVRGEDAKKFFHSFTDASSEKQVIMNFFNSNEELFDHYELTQNKLMKILMQNRIRPISAMPLKIDMSKVPEEIKEEVINLGKELLNMEKEILSHQKEKLLELKKVAAFYNDNLVHFKEPMEKYLKTIQDFADGKITKEAMLEAQKEWRQVARTMGSFARDIPNYKNYVGNPKNIHNCYQQILNNLLL